MNRRISLSVLTLILTLLAANWLAAGEPGPGLEILSAEESIDFYPSTGAQPQASGTPGQLAQPEPYYYPPAEPTVSGPYVGGPYPQISEPYVDTPAAADPFAAPAPVAPQAPFVSQPYSVDQGRTYADPFAPPPAAPAARVYETPEAVLAALNFENPAYPGLDAAVAQGNLAQASEIILRTLRERRIVNAALAAGPGASLGRPMPHEVAFINDLLFNANQNPGEPLNAVRRIDILLDTFEQPVLDDYGYAPLMEMVVTRLHADLTAVRLVLADPPEDVVYHEMARAYIRMATTCDFFVFPADALTADIDAVSVSAGTMFYPDGSSKGGDVGGVTGAAFHDMLLLDRYHQRSWRFGRTISSAWSRLETPARHLIGMALPDGSLPRFGPRGERELGPLDVANLKAIFAEGGNGVPSAGVNATHSYPRQSGAVSFGGLFASRSGSGGDARYLAVKFGSPGVLPGAPSHNDFGSIVVSSRSVNFVVDPGGFGGNAVEARAHSVLTLDGQAVLPDSYNIPGEPVDSVWRTNAAIDYAADAATFADGKRWQRGVIYVKGLPGEGGSDYWVLLDRVEMNGDNAPRRASIRFQLAPGVQAYHDGSGMLVTTDYGGGSALRIFAIDSNSELTLADGDMGVSPSYVFDNAGGGRAAPSVVLERTLVGDTTTTTLLYPGENSSYRPARIERDSDIIRGRTGAIVIDHGQDKIDVVAWAPPGVELITPTLNLQMSADVAVFRLRKGRIVRAAFVNLERFQAKEPDGGDWSMRVRGEPASLFLEPEANGGWQVLSDPANAKAVVLEDVNLGPAIGNRRLRIGPGEVRVIPR